MNPKVKMRAEMEEKFRRKYEEKAKELEAEFQRKFEEVKKDFARQVAEIYLDYQNMSKMGRQMSEDAAIFAIDDVFDVNEYSANKFRDQHRYYLGEIARMAIDEDKDDPDMEWTKDTVDRKLLQIVGKDNFVPWDDRLVGAADGKA
jgi:hypothetical protein